MSEDDIASEREDFFRNEALRKAMVKPKVPDDFDGESCYDCGDEISTGRLSIGAYRCVACQTLYEKRNKFFRS